MKKAFGHSPILNQRIFLPRALSGLRASLGFHKKRLHLRRILFETQFERLMAFVCSYVGDEEAAKDIVQDAFLTLWNNRRKLDKSLSVKSYLFAIAQNYALNYLRHRKVVADNEEPLSHYLLQEDEPVENREKLLAALDEKLKELPPQQRTILEKCVIQNKKYKEVADELGISVNTVKTHLARALKYLRDNLDEKKILFLYIAYSTKS